MSAAVEALLPPRAPQPVRAVAAPARVALLGTGQVAQALARRIDALAARGRIAPLSLLHVGNSRGTLTGSAQAWAETVIALSAVPSARHRDPSPQLAAEVDLVIDLTASDAVAAQHAAWLEAGIAVVTANKRGLGESAARARRIGAAIAGGAAYADSATVGAGLGAVRRLRELSACGETVFEIAGVLSGTLAWLFDHYDGSGRFSDLVRQAHALGLTEPDPRDDVGGADVVRKLRILARAVGWEVPDDGIDIDPRLRCGDGADPWADIVALDAGFAALVAERPDPEARLAVVARARPGEYRVAVEWLLPDDPLAQRGGCDNATLIRSERYDERPLVLRGPGAGPTLTAAAVLEDALALCRR